jgi:hypothetical protein
VEPTFFHGKSNASVLTKKWVGLHIGPFFTNSSGHPDREKNCAAVFLLRFISKLLQNAKFEF